MKRIFRFLLRAYPAPFREVYEEELVAFFEQQRRDPRYRGVVGSVRLWSGVVADVVANAARLRSARPPRPRERKTGEIVMGRDLRHAARRLVQAPGFSLGAILTLALGIGAATAIFSVVHAVVVSPLPYPDSERLVRLTHAAPGADIPKLGFSLGTYVHYREHNRTFDAMAVYESFAVNLTGEGEPERVDAAYVTFTFFDMFQAPMVGRAILEEDDQPGAEDVVVLSHRLWQRRYGSDAGVLDEAVLLDGNAFRVIGVMPPRFDVPAPETDLWVPWKLDPERVTLGGFSRLGIGRLRAGVSATEAESDLESLLPRFAERFADRSYHVQREDAPTAPDAIPPPAQTRGVTEGYFEALGVPLVAGRFIDRRDHEDRTGVVVVSQTFAERWWPGEAERALGKGVYPNISASPPWYRIVGVVGNVPTAALTEEPEEVLYFPMIGRDESIHVPRSMAFTVKVDGDPETFVPFVGREVAQLDASLPIANVRTLADIVSDARAPTAFAMTLLGIAALVALFLGAIGVYGAQSYMVSQRTGEIGVRMALGASATDVSRMILKRGGAIALGGIVLGWSAALLVTRWMESLLFDVPPTDIWTYGAVSFALVSAMLAASYLPARRAASQDPTAALRSE